MKEARTIAFQLLPREQVAAFNQAMLDLGAQHCRSVPICSTCPVFDHCRWRIEGGEDPAPRSAGVSRPQSVFEGSDRQVRGRVLNALRENSLTRSGLAKNLDDIATSRLEVVLQSLVRDGLIERHERSFRLSRG
jgi:A/G-specific adenine glycosylase